MTTTNILIILAFYQGLFSFLGENNIFVIIYKVLLFVLPIILFLKTHSYSIQFKGKRQIIIAFIFISICFFASYLLVTNPVVQIATHFNKYLIAFLFFFIFYFQSEYDKNSFLVTENLLRTLLVIQIIFSIIKIALFGIQEAIVGTISSSGASSATLLPVLGLILIWGKKAGTLSKRDWIFLLILLLIGIASDKRAIWYVFPISLVALNYYVLRRQIKLGAIVLTLALLTMIFYFGLRINSSLNPESKIWGSFDLEYALDYSKYYTFGDDKSYGEKNGRGAGLDAAILELSKNFSSLPMLLGNGVNTVYAGDYESFSAQKFWITNKASAGGSLRVLLAFGLFGMIGYAIFGFSLINTLKEKRLKYFFLLLFFWEYFLYHGSLLGTNALAILLVYLIVFLNDKFILPLRKN